MGETNVKEDGSKEILRYVAARQRESQRRRRTADDHLTEAFLGRDGLTASREGQGAACSEDRGRRGNLKGGAG